MTKGKIIRILLAAVAVAAGFYLLAPWEREEVASVVPEPPPMPSALLNELPNLSVTFGDRSSVIVRDLTGNVILVFFNPDCDHCQHEAEDIAANKEVFENWQVYFITSLDAKASEEFGVTYRLTDENYHFGSAGVNEVYAAVGQLSEVPTILVFKDRMFVRKFEGQTPVEEIKRVL